MRNSKLNNKATVVRTSELRIIFEKLLKHLDDLGLSAIVLENDYTWVVLDEHKYQFETDSPELGVAQLSEDWEIVLALMDRKREPTAYDLVHLAIVLEAIGDQVVT